MYYCLSYQLKSHISFKNKQFVAMATSNMNRFIWFLHHLMRIDMFCLFEGSNVPKHLISGKRAGNNRCWGTEINLKLVTMVTSIGLLFPLWSLLGWILDSWIFKLQNDISHNFLHRICEKLQIMTGNVCLKISKKLVKTVTMETHQCGKICNYGTTGHYMARLTTTRHKIVVAGL